MPHLSTYPSQDLLKPFDHFGAGQCFLSLQHRGTGDAEFV